MFKKKKKKKKETTVQFESRSLKCRRTTEPVPTTGINSMSFGSDSNIISKKQILISETEKGSACLFRKSIKLKHLDLHISF